MSASRLKIYQIGTLAVLCLTLPYCAKKPTEPSQAISSIIIVFSTSSIYAGSTVQFIAAAILRDGTQTDVTETTTWSVTPGHAGTITSKGAFTAAGDAVGTVVVRADYQGHHTQTQIEVTVRATSLVIWPGATTVVAGQTLQLEAIAEFQNNLQEYVTNKVSWRLTPGAAATIDANGLLSTKASTIGEELVIGTFQAYSARSTLQIKSRFESPMAMITIPAGSFIMGDDNGNANEKPAHEVHIADFQIGKYEVTNQQYVGYLNAALKTSEIIYESSIVTALKGPFAGREYCRIAGGPEFPDRFIEYVEVEPGMFEFQVIPSFENYPVVRIHWWGAAAFCAFYGLRLPTEAEWEKACRGGQLLEYRTSDGTISHELANFIGKEGRDHFESLAPIGSFPANPYGLHDMSGNAAEFVFDLYSRVYYANSPRSNPFGPGPKTLTQYV